MKHRSRPSNARAQGAAGVRLGVRVVAAVAAALATTVGSMIDIGAQTAPPRPLTQGLMPLETVEVVTVPGIDAAFAAASERPGEVPRPLQFASPFGAGITPIGGEIGRWEEARNETGGAIRVWRLRIASEDAVSLSLGFTRYAMPPEGRLWIYTPDYAQIAGPFTDADNERRGELWTPALTGHEVVVEIAVPPSAADDLDLELGSVNRGFPDILDTGDKQLTPTQLGRYRNMWQALTSSTGCTVDNLGTVSGTVRRNGALGHDCVSPNWSGELARYYSFTLARPTNIQIDMTSSAVDAWLGLREGAGTSGTLLLADDDSGGGTNARIAAELTAGTYTIEASTAVAGVASTGAFALTITPSAGPTGCTVDNLGTVSGTVRRNGALGHDCVSPNWSGELARYYSFTLARPTNIQIDMTSSAVDAWLGLRQGAGTSGTLLLADDDSGGGTNARIAAELTAGTYTIEASTAVAGVASTGAFALTITPSAGPTGCTVDNLGTVSGTVRRNGALGHDCVSPNWSGELARYYSFTLARPTNIQIDMTSSAVDAWLGLRQGAGTSGTLLLADDDSGAGTNARITAELTAGTYTIEASTAVEGVASTGAFALTITSSAPTGCTVDNLGTVSGTVRRNGALGHDCVSPNWSGELARYYSFTLARPTNIQIDMTSSAVDAWLGLREGAGTSGTLLRSDNDSGAGTNARITSSHIGTYTIEASTAVEGVAATGPFTLTITTSPFIPTSTSDATPVIDGNEIASQRSVVTDFTDHPVRPGTTPVKAAHFREIRARIAALRERAGLPAVSWTDPTLTAGATPVKRVHLTELRTALDAAYDALAQPRPVYTDAAVTGGLTVIKAVHVAELRAAVAALEATE